MGLDKIRKNEMEGLEDKFSKIESLAVNMMDIKF